MKNQLTNYQALQLLRQFNEHASKVHSILNGISEELTEAEKVELADLSYFEMRRNQAESKSLPEFNHYNEMANIHRKAIDAYTQQANMNIERF